MLVRGQYESVLTKVEGIVTADVFTSSQYILSIFFLSVMKAATIYFSSAFSEF